LGPWIVPADEVNPGAPLHLMTRINGELRQDDNTERLTWDFSWLLNYITQFATLKPGDLIFTGTPVGAGGHQNPPAWLKPGDVFEVEVPEIGVLRNTVVDEI
jgi:2-keto-4-pentenoate hydratase/2-oxohepta-3-ene-1,7-dioic acid hydratase in catechol pathway